MRSFSDYDYEGKRKMSGRRFIVLILALMMFLSACSGSASENKQNAGAGKSIKFSEEKEPQSYSTGIKSYSSAQERLSGMRKVSEYGGCELYYDESTCDIAIVKNGQIYFSTPWDLAGDSNSTDDQKQIIASQAVVSYMDSEQTIGTLSSFADCVLKGQYTYQTFENGIRFNMTLGTAEQRTLVAPAIPKDRFEKLTENLEGRALTRLKAFYRLYDPESTSEAQIALIRDKYPIVDEQAIYVLKEITDKERTELEGYLETAGYTFEDMEKDLESLNVDEEGTQKPYCKLAVCYQLTTNGLKIFIPGDSIEYNSESYKLLNIELLGYFLSENRGSDGYLLIPDGSGAVMGFNSDGLKLGNEITMPVYGYDRSLTYTSGYANLKTAAAPVFGIKKPVGGMFCVIGEGAAIADIIATSGGSVSGYARAGVRFNYRAYDTFDYKDVNTHYSWQLADSNCYTGDCSMTVYFLDAEKSDYSGMAECYREVLALEPSENESNSVPLILGMLGSIKHQEQVLLIPVMKNIALTSFEDAYTICGEMIDSGIDNLSVRYLGWSSGGLKPNAFDGADILGVLGGKSGLKDLSAKLTEKGVGLYMDADFVYAASNSLFDGFNAYSDTSRMLDKTYAGYNAIALSSGLYDSDSFKYAIRPQKMLKLFESFKKDYTSLGLSGLSLTAIGSDLNSNKDSKKGISREDALDYYNQILESAADEYDIISDGSNAYTYAYVSEIIGLSGEATGYPDADYSVPFLQMVLHGSRSYTTGAINLSGDMETEILKAVENGSGLYFELAYRNTEKIKTSDYADYYSVDYSVWKDTVIEKYNAVNQAIGDLSKEIMLSHSYPQNGVAEVTYSGGAVIYVNYNFYDCNIEGTNVPARSFVRVGE